MNEKNTQTMYERFPVISELNKVPNFDPLKFIYQTKDGSWKLDLKIKKLWFRLKYPSGKIKILPLKITDQLAIIEARVYFDKNDTEPAASYIAQTEKNTAPGGLYIEMAERIAADTALSEAGFGIQFIPANETEYESSQNTVVHEQEHLAIKKASPIIDTTPQTAESNENIVQSPSIEPNITAAPMTAKVEEKSVNAQITPQTDLPEPTEAETDSTQEDSPEEPEINHPLYTNEMSVDEICALMSVEEAGNIIVPIGTCKSWTLSQVANRRPVSLKWYLTAYTGDDHIFLAALKIMLSQFEQKAG